jgi:hypothetical protein
MNIRKRK